MQCTIYSCMKISSCNRGAQWCVQCVDLDCYIVNSSIAKLNGFVQPSTSKKFRMVMQI